MQRKTEVIANLFEIEEKLKNDLENSKELAEKAFNELQKGSKNIENENRRLLLQINGLETANAELSEEILTKKSKINEISKEVKHLNEELKKQEEAFNDSLKNNRRESNEKIDELNKELGNLFRKNEEEKRLIKNGNKLEVDSLNQVLNQMQADRKELEERIDLLAKDLEQSEKKNTTFSNNFSKTSGVDSYDEDEQELIFQEESSLIFTGSLFSEAVKVDPGIANFDIRKRSSSVTSFSSIRSNRSNSTSIKFNEMVGKLQEKINGLENQIEEFQKKIMSSLGIREEDLIELDNDLPKLLQEKLSGKSLDETLDDLTFFREKETGMPISKFSPFSSTNESTPTSTPITPTFFGNFMKRRSVDIGSGGLGGLFTPRISLSTERGKSERSDYNIVKNENEDLRRSKEEISREIIKKIITNLGLELVENITLDKLIEFIKNLIRSPITNEANEEIKDELEDLKIQLNEIGTELDFAKKERNKLKANLDKEVNKFDILDKQTNEYLNSLRKAENEIAKFKRESSFQHNIEVN